MELSENTTFEDRQALKLAKRQELMKKNALFNESDYKKHLYSTGSYILDSNLYGGLPFGKPIEIFGPESSGKTSLTFKMAEQVNRINYDSGELDLEYSNPCSVAFIDLEHAFDHEWAFNLGFDPDNYGNNVDSIIGGDTVGDIVKDYIDSDMYSMIIIDSLDSMFPVKVLEEDMETNDIGLRAKTLYRAMRKWIVSLAKSYKRHPQAPWRCPSIVMLNHSQPIMMDLYGREESPGGKSVKFYSVVRLKMSGLKIENDSSKDHGVGRFKATVIKNKISGPAGMTAEWNMALKELENLEVGQIDNVKDIFADIRRIGAIEKLSGSKVTIFGEEYPTQKAFKEKMYEDPEFMKQIWDKMTIEVNK